MASGKSLAITFLVVLTLSSMSLSLGLSLEARHLLQTTGQRSTPSALPRRSQIGILGPRPNMYYPDYIPIPRTPIPGYTPLPIAPLPDYPPHKHGLRPIGMLGPGPNMYYPASYTPNSIFPSPTPPPFPNPFIRGPGGVIIIPIPPPPTPIPIPGPFHSPFLHNPAKMSSVP